LRFLFVFVSVISVILFLSRGLFDKVAKPIVSAISSETRFQPIKSRHPVYTRRHRSVIESIMRTHLRITIIIVPAYWKSSLMKASRLNARYFTFEPSQITIRT